MSFAPPPDEDVRTPALSLVGSEKRTTMMIRQVLGPGNHDLGDIQLFGPGAAGLQLLNDQALEQRYRDAEDVLRIYREHLPNTESMLAEMSRRGGPHWIAFLKDKYAQSQNAKFRGFAKEILYLTALRRAERKADPLSIKLSKDSQLEASFPESPVVVFDLTHTDEEEENLPIITGGSYRSGRFARCQIEVFRENEGWVGERVPASNSMGGGLMGTQELRPGESFQYSIQITSYVEFPGPGEYRIRVNYHNDRDIDALDDLSGSLHFRTGFFKVRLSPRTLRISRQEHSALRQAVRYIDTHGAVPILSSPVEWIPGAAAPSFEFEGELEPIDRVYAGGLRAVPAMLEELAGAQDQTRRGWILGMLWNVTGVHNPISRRREGAIENSVLIGGWRQSANEDLYRHKFGTSHRGQVAEGQEILCKKWNAAREWIQFEFID